MDRIWIYEPVPQGRSGGCKPSIEVVVKPIGNVHLPERVEKEKRGPGAEPTGVQPGRDSQEERFPARRERAQHGSGRGRGRKTLGRGPREKRQHSAWQLEGVLNTGNFLPSCNHVNKAVTEVLNPH